MTDERRERAMQRVGELKGFYSHLSVFLLINLLLVIINYVTSPGYWWFYWVTLAWGVALLFHAAHVFGRGKILTREWEEKKIEQYMNEEGKE